MAASFHRKLKERVTDAAITLLLLAVCVSAMTSKLFFRTKGSIGLYVHRNHYGLLGTGKLGGREFYI